MPKRIRSKEYKEKAQIYGKKYYAEHRDEIRDKKKKEYKSQRGSKDKAYLTLLKKRRIHYKGYAIKAKMNFVEMYGKACSCCGESIMEFLTIEHILGQSGVKNKEKSTKAYIKATKEYRPDLYEILCYNCNNAKGQYGRCPHELH